jgi:hypothetical protein
MVMREWMSAASAPDGPNDPAVKSTRASVS